MAWKKRKIEPTGGLFDDPPMSHASDPPTSAEAARNHAESGRRDAHAALVLDLVRRHPGSTAVELWGLATDAERGQLVEMQEIRRRCTDLLARCLVRQGPARDCSVKGTSMVVWFAESPAQPEPPDRAELAARRHDQWRERRGY